MAGRRGKINGIRKRLDISKAILTVFEEDFVFGKCVWQEYPRCALWDWGPEYMLTMSCAIYLPLLGCWTLQLSHVFIVLHKQEVWNQLLHRKDWYDSGEFHYNTAAPPSKMWSGVVLFCLIPALPYHLLSSVFKSVLHWIQYLPM